MRNYAERCNTRGSFTPGRWAIAPVLVFVLAACGTDNAEPVGFVIANARVIDGSGGPSRDVSVRVNGERIVEVGDFAPSLNDTVIDAGGLALAPGFFDTHSHHDESLFELPDVLASVSQGVTTIVAGQDGSQNYPLRAFFARLETEPVAVNVASYAGHGTLRNEVMGKDYRRRATASELAAMAALLRAEMQAGAVGLSSGLEYDPGSFAATEELVELARIAAASGGLYASHIRNEDLYFWEAVDEAIEIGRAARIPVRVTHIKLAMSRWWGQADKLTAVLDEARTSGVDVSADVYPYRAWYSHFSWLATLFPERDLSRRDGADYVLGDMLAPERILIPVFRPEPAYNGMTVAEIADLRGTDPQTTLMALLQADAAAGGVESGSEVLAFAMDEPDIEAIMAWPHTVIASDGDSVGAHPRGYGTFSRFLGHYIRERRLLSLEDAVRRITSLPAAHLGIAERGTIQASNFADLVLFDPDTITDHATFENPQTPSTGIVKVWVNGVPVFENSDTTGHRPGKPVRSAHPRD